MTALMQTAIANVNFAGNVFEFDQTLKNTSPEQTILPPLRFTITAIHSNSGVVRVANADNGGNGMESAALFDYSNAVGADRTLTPGETSGARHLKFNDSAGELFTFTATVKGHFPDPAFAASSVGQANGKKQFKVRLRFTADPVSRSVQPLGVE